MRFRNSQERVVGIIWGRVWHCVALCGRVAPDLNILLDKEWIPSTLGLSVSLAFSIQIILAWISTKLYQIVPNQWIQ